MDDVWSSSRIAGPWKDRAWLDENDLVGEPPISPEMTTRMESGQEFVVER